MDPKAPAASAVEEILSRARRAAGRGEPHWALRLFKSAVMQLPEGEQQRRRDILLEMLDLEEDEFGEAGPVTLELAGSPLFLSAHEDSRLLKMRGWQLSREARVKWKARPTDDPGVAKECEDAAFDLANQAVEVLQRAVAADAGNGDAWGTLGGVWRQVADWYQELARDQEEAQSRKRALAAYESGSKTFHPYPTLTFFEERAVLERNQPFFRDENERKRLSEALRIRRKHLLRGQQIPWAAFDLARGRYYLELAEHHFFEDLNVALDQAIASAAGPEERGAVATTRRTMARVAGARDDLPGLKRACLLLDAALLDHSGWYSGSYLSPMDATTRELRRTVPRIEALRIWVERSQRDAQSASEAAWQEILRVGRLLQAELNEQEEEKLQAAIADLKDTSMWGEERLLRFLWKSAGGEVVKEIVAETLKGVIPGGGLLVKVLSIIAGKIVAPE